MKTKILSITDFAKTKPKKTKLTVAQIRTQLAEANALWPFGWY